MICKCCRIEMPGATTMHQYDQNNSDNGNAHKTWQHKLTRIFEHLVT
jgi:hypothetical protein